MPTMRETRVPVERTRAEIERLLGRFKATGFAYGSEVGRAMIGFQTKERRIRFMLPLVAKPAMSQKQVEQMVRYRWRALYLTIKAKLEGIDAGIETFDEAFIAHVVMPDGKTLAEHAIPYIKEAYASGKVPALAFGT